MQCLSLEFSPTYALTGASCDAPIMMVHGFPESSRQGMDRRLPVDFLMIAVNPMDARLPKGPFTPTSIRFVFRVVWMERVRPSGERPTLHEKIN